MTGGRDGSLRAWDLRLQHCGATWSAVHPHTGMTHDSVACAGCGCNHGYARGVQSVPDTSNNSPAAAAVHQCCGWNQSLLTTHACCLLPTMCVCLCLLGFVPAAPVEAIVLPPVASRLPWSTCVLSVCAAGRVALTCLASGCITRTFDGWDLGPPAQLAWSTGRCAGLGWVGLAGEGGGGAASHSTAYALCLPLSTAWPVQHLNSTQG